MREVRDHTILVTYLICTVLRKKHQNILDSDWYINQVSCATFIHRKRWKLLYIAELNYSLTIIKICPVQNWTDQNGVVTA
jgi:hypothetical protein